MAKLIGTDPNQVPTNADLGDMAYKNGDNLKAGPLTVVDESVSIGGQAPTTVFDINVERPIGTTIRLYGSNNSGAQTLYESFNGKDFRVGIENSSGSLGYGSAAYDRYLFSEGSFPITFSTDSTERMRIDASGRVTMPYQPAFSYLGSHSYSIATTGTQTMSSSNVWAASVNHALNRGSHFNPSTGRFTAPIAGTYHFQFTCTASEFNSGYLWFYMSINGSAKSYVQASQQTEHTMIVHNFYFELSANDYASVQWTNNYASGKINYPGFSGYLVG